MSMWANSPASKVEQITSISRVEIVTVGFTDAFEVDFECHLNTDEKR